MRYFAIKSETNECKFNVNKLMQGIQSVQIGRKVDKST